MWRLYGWFSGLMCLGSAFGAVTWGVWMQALVALFNGSLPALTPTQMQSLNAQSQYWAAAFYVPYAIVFMCLTVAELLVLDRMADFAVTKGDAMRRRLAVGGRIVMAAVVVGNLTGVIGNLAAAVYSKEAGDLFMAASAAYADNATAIGNNFSNLAAQQSSVASFAASVQQFCEVIVLLIIILAFAVVGIACARRVSSALRITRSSSIDEHGVVSAAGRQLRRKIVGTAAFVFVTFLLRAVFATMNALANALQTQSTGCDTNPCDPSCYNFWYIILLWLQFTPEFQLMVVLISSPLALLVALWGMTSKHVLQRMSSSGGQMVNLRNSQVVNLRTSQAGARLSQGEAR